MMKRAIIAAITLSAAVTAARGAGGDTSYSVDPASRLAFVGIQAGAEFTGTFHKFTATVDFAPDALANAHFDVLIDMGSVDSKDDDRDKILRGPDIFDVARFPSAHYVTRVFTKTATGYSAVGALTLHGVTKDVPIDFRFISTPAMTKLEGTAQLRRLDFGVGQGDWKSTEWIGDAVKVTFSLALKPKP